MSKNPFVVLGVSENASQNEIYQAYVDLRNYYSDLRFKEGEEGADAAEKYAEVEEAYAQASEIVKGRTYVNDFGSPIQRVEQLLKENDLEEAQRILDSVSYRNDEWHYLQAAVYYKKGWLDDSRKQLELALSLSPGNEKYKKTLNELNGGSGKQEQKTEQRPFTNNPYESPRNYRPEEYSRSYRNRSDSDTACNICSGLVCADCCCECMGGDLISCC